MADDIHRRHDGGQHEGPSRTSPYPLSRMAPPHDLVNVAAEIQKADALLGTVTSNKLQVIVDQIRALQDQAQAVLEHARHAAELHRAKCNFEKRPGKIYHLYRLESGDNYFSMLSPEEWVRPPAQTFVGSYRLELDMSWTPVDQVEAKDRDQSLVRRWVGEVFK